MREQKAINTWWTDTQIIQCIIRSANNAVTVWSEKNVKFFQIKFSILPQTDCCERSTEWFAVLVLSQANRHGCKWLNNRKHSTPWENRTRNSQPAAFWTCTFLFPSLLAYGCFLISVTGNTVYISITASISSFSSDSLTRLTGYK